MALVRLSAIAFFFDNLVGMAAGLANCRAKLTAEWAGAALSAGGSAEYTNSIKYPLGCFARIAF